MPEIANGAMRANLVATRWKMRFSSPEAERSRPTLPRAPLALDTTSPVPAHCYSGQPSYRAASAVC
jgi:hypothetical protein